MNGFALLLSAAEAALSLAREAQVLGALVWLLVFIFLWSGLVKVANPVMAAGAIVDFGLSKRLRPRLGIAAGVAELALAAALLLFGSQAAVIAALTLSFFVYLIGRSLLLGKAHACYCFGDSTEGITRWTLLRSLALALLATALAFVKAKVAVWGATAVAQLVMAAALFGIGALGGWLPRLFAWVDEYVAQ